MTPQALAAQIRPLLPSGMTAEVTRLSRRPWWKLWRARHLHVRIGTYHLTITRTDKPISAENIVEGAAHMLSRESK